MLKSPKTNTLADGLIEGISSMLDEIASETDEDGDRYRKMKHEQSETLSKE